MVAIVEAHEADYAGEQVGCAGSDRSPADSHIGKGGRRRRAEVEHTIGVAGGGRRELDVDGFDFSGSDGERVGSVHDRGSRKGDGGATGGIELERGEVQRVLPGVGDFKRYGDGGAVGYDTEIDSAAYAEAAPSGSDADAGGAQLHQRIDGIVGADCRVVPLVRRRWGDRGR